MPDEECDEHLQPLPGLIDNEIDTDSSADEDQLEIVSDTEENENLLVCLNNYLNLGSADDTEGSDDEGIDHSIEELIEENEHVQGGNFRDPTVVDNTSSLTLQPTISGADVLHSPQPLSTVTSKRKRRQWSIKEKLLALGTLEKNHDNKKLTANQCGCTQFQLSQWVKRKADFKDLLKFKHGKKRKRLCGGGSKIKYIELDHRLLLWFRQKRTFIDPQTVPTTGTTSTTIIRREKVTFRQLQRQGKLLSIELKHNCPSTKWFARFMRRHRLSLQKPKRNQTSIM